MAKNVAFTLPGSFITQLGEFTDGFFLASINELGDIEVTMSLDTTIKRLAMQQFLEAVAAQGICSQMEDDDGEVC